MLYVFFDSEGAPVHAVLVETPPWESPQDALDWCHRHGYSRYVADVPFDACEDWQSLNERYDTAE